MDATPLYPEGYHPVLSELLPDASGVAPFIPRYAAPTPVKYYFTNFENAVYIPEHAPAEATGARSISENVPELVANWEGIYDPFKVDVFVLGKQLHNFSQVRRAPLSRYLCRK